VWRVLVNSRSRQLTDAERYKITRATEVFSPDEVIAESAAWWTGQSGDYSNGMDADVANATAFWQSAA
jgi:hypothetical protein